MSYEITEIALKTSLIEIIFKAADYD